MRRIVRGRGADLPKTFTFTPTGAPTVTVTRSDGTPVTVSAVSGSGTTWQYTIPASSNTLLDTLTETWLAVRNGEPQAFTDTIEAAGDTLFTLAELRATSPPGQGLNNATNYPDAKLAEIRTRVEQSLEDACGVAFVPRYTVETRSGTGGVLLPLKWPLITAIRSVTINGVPVTPVSSAVGLSEGMVSLDAGWTTGYGNLTVAYEHGHQSPPERIRQAGLLLAKQWLVGTALDDRAITQTTDAGTFSLFQAGVRGHTFSIPEVQAAVDAYSMTVSVA